jgi:hypothetical protein
VENFAEFPFCSKVEAAYGLEIVSNVITVIASPPYVDMVRLECSCESTITSARILLNVVDRLQHVESKTLVKHLYDLRGGQEDGKKLECNTCDGQAVLVERRGVYLLPPPGRRRVLFLSSSQGRLCRDLRRRCRGKSSQDLSTKSWTGHQVKNIFFSTL